MTVRELNKYRPQKTGIRMMVNDYDHQNQIATISLFGSDKSMLPQDEISKNDINNELARMEKKLVSDKIRHKKPETGSPFLVKETPLLFLPPLQGENDCLNSRATNIKDKWIPKEEFRDVQQYYERMKSKFDNHYKVQCEEEKKIRDRKFVRVKSGEVITI
jgi:hypothetical protein